MYECEICKRKNRRMFVSCFPCTNVKVLGNLAHEKGGFIIWVVKWKFLID